MARELCRSTACSAAPFYLPFSGPPAAGQIAHKGTGDADPPGQLQQSLLPVLPFLPTIPILQAGALCGRGGESCGQKENRVLGFLQPAARCLLWHVGGGQRTVGAASRLWAGGKAAKMQLQAADSELERCSQARLHSSQSGHTEEVRPAEGCRAVLTKRSPMLQFCMGTDCSSSSHCRSSEATTAPTPNQAGNDNIHTQIHTRYRIWHSTVLPELVAAF